MKLSKETRDILKNFSQINPSIKIDAGSLLMTKSINNTIYAEAEVNEVFTEEWSIYSLSAFLQILSLIGEDADIVSDGQILTITGSGMEVKYNLSESSLIAYPAKRPVLPSADLIFELSHDHISQVLKASQTLSFDTIAITQENGKLLLKAFDSKSKNSNLFSIELGNYQEENKFNFMMPVSSLNFIKSDYQVYVAAAGAIKFESKSAENKHSYIIALLDTSTHDFEG